MDKRGAEAFIQAAPGPSLALRKGLVVCANKEAEDILGCQVLGQSLRRLFDTALPAPRDEDAPLSLCRFYWNRQRVEIERRGDWELVTLSPGQGDPSATMDMMFHVEAAIRRRLSVLLPNLQMLERQLCSDAPKDTAEWAQKAERYLSEATRGSYALLNLSQTLQQAAADLAGNTRFRPYEADVGALLRNVCENARTTIELSGIELHADIGDGPFVAVLDGADVEAVFYELVSSAIGHSDRGQEVTVRLTEEEDTFCVTLTDRAGSDSELRGGPLDGYRPQTDRGAWLDMGLPLATAYITSHGGALRIESAEARHTVTLMLPPPCSYGDEDGVSDVRKEYESGYPKALVALADVASNHTAYLKGRIPYKDIKE